MRTAIWGDGPVGRGLAVALSHASEVVLVGPEGAGRRTLELSASGAIRGRASVELLESSDRPAADMGILAVKAYDAATAAADMLGVESILCVSNGIGFEEELPGQVRERLEYAPLTYGFRRLVDHVEAAPGMVFLGSSSAFLGLFRESGLAVEAADDLPSVRWAKWAVNSIINPLGAITGLPNNALLDAGLGELAGVLLEELKLLVPKEKRHAALGSAKRMLDRLLAESGNRCSMLQDIDAGRRTEIDYLTGLCGKRLPGRCPTAFALSSLVRALEADHPR